MFLRNDLFNKILNLTKITKPLKFYKPFINKNFSFKRLPDLHKYSDIKLNLKNFLKDFPLYKSNTKIRNVNADVEKVTKLYSDYLSKLNDINLMRKQLNTMKSTSKDLIKSGKAIEQLIKDQKKHAEDIIKFQGQLELIEYEMMKEALKIPNLTHPESPVGDESKANIIKICGNKPNFNFKPLDHLELGKIYDLFDFDNATKITGSKFVILKNEAALLEQALINYAIAKLIKKGFKFITTPDICYDTIIEGCGFNPREDNNSKEKLKKIKIKNNNI
jgi:seryl-tRNA synthetase